MTQFQNKAVNWLLYPDLTLPHEQHIELPRQVVKIREREAFIQRQKQSYKATDRASRVARQALDSIYALLNPPQIAQNAPRRRANRANRPNTGHHSTLMLTSGDRYILIEPCLFGLHNQVPLDTTGEPPF